MGREQGPARHPGSWSFVDGGVETRAYGPHGHGTGRPTSTTAGTSLALQVLFAQLEAVGSGAPAFWNAFWLLFPQLSDEEVQRVVFATGERGLRHRTAIRAEQHRRR